MGFNFKKLSDSRCIFEAGPSGDDSAEFLTCVQSALKGAILDICIDLGGRSEVAGAILPHILKLQKVLLNHKGLLTIQGLDSKFPAELAKRLMDLGIKIAVPRGVDSAPTSAVTASQTTQSVIEGTPSETLPSGDEVFRRFAELRKRLGGLLARKKFLEIEKQGYTERLACLSKGQGQDTVAGEQIREIAGLEAQLASLKEARSVSERKIGEAQSRKESAEAAKNKSLGDLQTELKKARMTPDKKLADLLKQREKIIDDSKRRAASKPPG